MIDSEGKDNLEYGPQYQSGRPRILHYGNDDHVLYLSVELPDGMKRTDAFVLPNATPVPGERQLKICAGRASVKNLRGDGPESLRLRAFAAHLSAILM